MRGLVGSRRAGRGPGGPARSIGAWGWGSAPCFSASLESLPAKLPVTHTPHNHTTEALPSQPTGPEFTRPTDKQPPLHPPASRPRSTHSLSPPRGSPQNKLSSHSHATHTPSTHGLLCLRLQRSASAGEMSRKSGKTIHSLVPPPHALARHFHAASTFGRLS